jgi:anti-anti-sigma regulatory factor
MTPEREDELKVALMMSFDNADHLVVNLGKVTGVDHSALRLLRTLQQKSSSFKKRLTLIGISTDALKQAT